MLILKIKQNRIEVHGLILYHAWNLQRMARATDYAFWEATDKRGREYNYFSTETLEANDVSACVCQLEKFFGAELAIKVWIGENKTK